MAYEFSCRAYLFLRHLLERILNDPRGVLFITHLFLFSSTVHFSLEL